MMKKEKPRHLCKHVIACLLYTRKELNIQKETMLSKFLKKNSELVKKGDYLIIIKKFMQSVFRRIRKGGFIEYDKMIDFAIAIDKILEYLKTITSVKKDKKLLLNICLYLINTISSTKYNCDDSNGEITDSFYTIINFLEEIFTEPNHEFFNQIYLDLTNPKNEYEFELNKLIEFATKLAQTDIDKQQIKKFKTQVF